MSRGEDKKREGEHGEKAGQEEGKKKAIEHKVKKQKKKEKVYKKKRKEKEEEEKEKRVTIWQINKVTKKQKKLFTSDNFRSIISANMNFQRKLI